MSKFGVVHELVFDFCFGRANKWLGNCAKNVCAVSERVRLVIQVTVNLVRQQR